MDSEDIEITDDVRLGPPRLTRLEPEADQAVLLLASAEERPVAQVLRRLVREALAARQAPKAEAAA